MVYWQPLLVWNVARRNALFWISGHWNILKRLLSKEKRTIIKTKQTLLNKNSYLVFTHETTKRKQIIKFSSKQKQKTFANETYTFFQLKAKPGEKQ